MYKVDLKDCNSHTCATTLQQKFFLRITLVSVSCDYLAIFIYTGKPDWIVHVMLNQQSILERSVVNGSFFGATIA